MYAIVDGYSFSHVCEPLSKDRMKFLTHEISDNFHGQPRHGNID